MKTTLRKHSVMIAGHATSISLEPEFWEMLRFLAQEQGISINALISKIDQKRQGNLSSALRVLILNNLCQRCGLDLKSFISSEFTVS